MISTRAQMIGADREHGSAPTLSRAFDLDPGHGSPVRAVLSASALGLIEATINGHPASDDLLTPGWSSYEWRLRFAEWDVTGLIAERNTVELLIGHGWHSGRLGFVGGRALYGEERAAIAELRIEFADGHVQSIVTDGDWRSGGSRVLADDLYDGQTIDARHVEQDEVSGVTAIPFEHARLTPYVAPPVRRQELVAPVRIWTSPAGATLIDFGQNLVGWVRVETRGERGRELVLRHAEVLEDGELGIRPLRSAKATDRFILSGGDDVFEPTFTFHGFRYASIEGWEGGHEELAASVRAQVIGSELARIGTFASSDPLLDQLHANVVWGMRGNFVDVPTDCPQRDERLGWTGDIAAFATTAVFLYDVDAFLRDWLLDLAAEQTASGGEVPVVVPDNIKFQKDLAWIPPIGRDTDAPLVALWADSAAWVPWAVWQAYGDRAVLEQQYGSMAAYARRIDEAFRPGGALEPGGAQLGDWLDPTAPPEAPFVAKADPYVVAVACVYRSARIVADTARLLGRADDAAEFEELAGRLRAAFNDRWVDAGRIFSDATTVYALAICFGLLDEEDRALAGARLAELVHEGGYRITTGFAGTPFITHALSSTGHLDSAYRLLLQTECPSWLYPVTMGATTVWERWDSMLPDGTVNPGEMTSFNHYALGAVADWLHRVVAGLDQLEPGYSRLLIAPRPGGGLTWAEASLATRLGPASVHWELIDDALVVDVVVPEGRMPSSVCPAPTR